jgi:hypothetical protein
VLGAVATLMERRRHQFIETDDIQLEPLVNTHEESGPRVPVLRKPAPPPSNAELDAVLEKISKQGMDSLTNVEREVLAKETERRRRG